jgi:type II secretory pathway pseudopilin PulG
LIELLIVVANLAILAVIAVSNFVEAQVRSKVSRVQGDLRSIATAMETYCVDHNCYPCTPMSLDCLTSGCCCWQTALTTPIAYIVTNYSDIFAQKDGPTGVTYLYAQCKMNMGSWILVSVGPDQTTRFIPDNWMCGMAATYPMPYDPTNGTVSFGDILRLNRQSGPELIPPE